MKEPALALRVLWPFIISKEDPGNDDGQLCVLLFEIIAEAIGRQAVEELVLTEWPRLSAPIRRNIVVLAGSTKAMSTELGLRLFEHSESQVEQRHLIVAGFAAGDKERNCGHLLVDMAKRIGSYSDPHRQRILEGFVADLIRNYG